MIEREKRFEIARKAEKRFKDYVQPKYMVQYVGQEHWVKQKLHKKLRKIHGNTTVDFLRHFPDLVVYRANILGFIDIKETSEKYRDGENFSIEVASLKTLRNIESITVNVKVVFENYPNEFFSAWPSDIPRKNKISLQIAKNMNGSGTPFYLVKKEKLPKLSLPIFQSGKKTLKEVHINV